VYKNPKKTKNATASPPDAETTVTLLEKYLPPIAPFKDYSNNVAFFFLKIN